MDAELSLVMTNLALVKRGSMAFDPFVGTGSILVACGLRGAGHCVGTDIDLRVLRGDGKAEDVFSNFRQYGLRRPELVRSDNALYHRHYRGSRHGQQQPLYDAIVTDPPYGIRAGARQSGSRRPLCHAIKDEHRADHVAQTRPYAVSDVMADLLDVAARTLAVGGRLVYVIPSLAEKTTTDDANAEGGFDEETDLPRHACLRRVYTCFQPLQHPELGRRTVTMEKVAEYDEAKREEYLGGVWANGPEAAEKCANIRDRIVEAARRKPGYEEKAAVRREKRRATREARKKAKREAVVARGEANGGGSGAK
jgi:tRNA (guanine10-N2)-methyltransferase